MRADTGIQLKQRRRRRAALVAVSAALVLGTAACGSPGAPTADPTKVSLTAAQLVFKATDAGKKASTARFTLRMTTSAEGQVMTMLGRGQVNSADKSAIMALKMRIPGAGAYAVQERVVGGTIYMRGFPGAGSQWLKVDLAQARLLMGSRSTQNPADQLDMLKQLGADIHEAGPATVNGVATTKYTGVLDMQKALATKQEDPGTAETVQSMVEQVTRAGLKAVPFTVNVDRNGLPVRVTMKMVLRPAAAATNVKVSVLVDYSDWGVPVTVVAPAGAVSATKFLSASSSR